MAKKLFVGSLSWDTNDAKLLQAFSRFGEITEAKVITDRDSGRSRGFGFVTFEDDEAADRAIAALNGTELDGRSIKVNVAQERSRTGGSWRRRRRPWRWRRTRPLVAGAATASSVNPSPRRGSLFTGSAPPLPPLRPQPGARR